MTEQERLELIRLATLVVMVIFMAVAFIVLKDVFDVIAVEKRIKEWYIIHYQNYTCVHKSSSIYEVLNKNARSNACVYGGYYYPACPNTTIAGNISLPKYTFT